MSRKRQPFKAMIRISRKVSLKFLREIKKQIIWLLRTIFRLKGRREAANAGFILPTVAMVSIVVVLLTLAIMFRSFDRAKNASNVRVNEAVVNAATPALDRARAKIKKLFADTTLPRATPSDDALYTAIAAKIQEYTFGDEATLNLSFDINKDADTSDAGETLNTAWRYPVDTDNNGKFDSYTLYGIYFKNPTITAGQYDTARNPLQARTPPMNASNLSGSCKDTIGTSATLVGINGWFKIGNKLKKSFFVYSTTVPITKTLPDTNNYEIYSGNKGFSAVEYQQDRVQLPPSNNAVIYEDDLVITLGGTPLRLNGRIFTNSNLLTGSEGGTVRFYQVSSPESCFYEAENAKIIIGGNLGAGKLTATGNLATATTVDLYNGQNTTPSSTPNVTSNVSVTDKPNELGYNSLAYTNRINTLVDAQFAKAFSTDPSEVTLVIEQEKTKPSYTSDKYDSIRQKQLELYFKKRTRRVPFKEVGFGVVETVTSPLQGSGDELRPIDAWMYPFDPTDGKTSKGYSELTLNTSGSNLIPGATEPTKLQKTLSGVEGYFGDRALIGNNLPEKWWDSTKKKFVSSDFEDTQQISGINWNNGDGTRTRRSGVQTLADLGDTDRDKDWELEAAKIPNNIQDPVGGLRVVTGAGIYLPSDKTAASTSFTSGIPIWSDMMPSVYATVPAPIKPFELYGINIQDKVPQPGANTPYLQMRATAVYHYKSDSYSATSPQPIACVSSYYDPTNSTTANNKSTLPDAVGITKSADGRSNNGIVYGKPTKTESDYTNLLSYEKDLKYSNGRWVNEPLQKALATGKTSTNRTLSERSAIDAAVCALQIMDGSISVAATLPIPHGAIREIAFLDERQVQTNQTSTPASDLPYDLPLKDRQPLEIRATVLDLNQLRTKTIGTTTPAQEYLLPNSGIIYATRDDALLDRSAATDKNNPTEAENRLSPVDYKLDPTRRPNGIVLLNSDKTTYTNGTELFRGSDNTFREVEKGLILVSNLPVYIKGDFNKHSSEEFTEALKTDWSNIYTRTSDKLDPNFACRKNDPRLPKCTTGDKWRPAVVIADAITLLSDNFKFGFRDDGDYDWKPDSTTIPSELAASFSANNNYVPKTKWYDTTGTSIDTTKVGSNSSYFNNFVTPIMKWTPVPELATEIQYCETNKGVKTCGWTLTTAGSCNGIGSTYKEGQPANAIKTGTLTKEPDGCYANLPKRIAYVRDADGNLVKDGSGNIQVWGVDDSTNPKDGRIQIFSITDSFPFGTSGASTKLRMSTDKFMPWLKPSLEADGKTLVYKPLLQINQPFASSTDPTNATVIKRGSTGGWLQTAAPSTGTTFNLIAAGGDTPARFTEDNGGLQSFTRFMEVWGVEGASTAVPAKISGAFIQFKRSAYATGPYSTMISTQGNEFLYKIDNNTVKDGGGTTLGGKTNGFLPPDRQWGYDVGLLPQTPDAFSQKLVTTPADLPNEYFREVGRDDKWVKTLLCAKTTETGTPYAIDADQRPSCS